ncbi:MAG: sulfotransferase, partial [Chloroflexota bacterium]|nr:sulfotransferase [Chloroflexota bacterium]
DEFAISMMSLRSPLIGWSFPRREEHYERYLTFRGVSEKEVERWKAAFVIFLKKLTWKYKRPLILKSPVHTARIRLLLDLFPDARFVHIHRNPYTVFQSTRWLYEKTVSKGYLQHPQAERINDGILRRYAKMYDAFFEEWVLIPDGQFYEIGFEELEKDMLGQLDKVYECLGIPGFRDAEPAFRRYVDSIANYKKNVYPPLAEPLRQQVAQAWRRSFEEWGYTPSE